MADEWSRSALELLLPIDRSDGVRAGLERALREAVRDGRLPPGTRLPSSRALATDFGLARGTVTQAYEQLVAEGFLTARPRSGVEVAARPVPARTAGPRLSREWPEPIRGADLRPGLPDLSLFPRREWLQATKHVLQTVPNSTFGYGDWSGHTTLRETLAEYLGRSRGVVATADQIIVCAGYTHAIRMVCQAFARFGATTVGFEDPSLLDYPELARQCGLTVTAIPVDRDGLVIERLTGERGVFVTPAHQYPLGVTLSPVRRTELLAWAGRQGAFVVEDDYDGEFRYDRQPVGALQGLAPERVVYAGTASKSIGPGLRLGWLVVPPELVPVFKAAAYCDDSYVSVVDQLALARLIATGELDRHLRRCRVRYRRRRDMLGAAVAERAPNAHLSGIAAGLHAVLQVPGVEETELVRRLAARQVAVDGLAGFYTDPDGSPPGIVIGYATPPEHAYAGALDALVGGLRG